MEDKLEPILTMIAKDTHEKLSEANINLENNIQQGARIEKEVLSAGETSKQILAEISKPKEEKGPIEIKIPGVEMVTLKGEKGDRGDKGDRGEKGERGDQGPRGEKGADSTVPGPKGDIGPQGERGPQGEAKTGERGPKGDRGERGEKGESGSPDTGAEIISKIKAVKEGRLNIDDIDGTGLFVRKSERNDTGYLRELSDVDLGSLEPANGQALIYNSTTKKWSPGTVASTGGGTPASPNSSVQFNNAGAFGGSSEFTWNNATKTLNVQASSDDGSTLSQRWMDSNGDARAYVASNGDAFFNHITAGDLVDGPVKSSGGSLTNSAIDLNSTDVTGVLQVTKGGTGLSAFASGDIIYASAANTLSARAIGSSGDILTVSGGFPVWASTSSLLDGTYLRLDTTNGPLTGNLFVTKTDAKLRATDNTGSINYSELFANSTEVGFNFSIIDGESTGAIRYDGVSFSLSTNLSDAYTFSSSALLYFSGTSSSTQPAFYIIGDRAVSGTNTNGGDVVITPGISRGSGTSNSILQATGGGSSGTADSNPVTVATFAYNRATVTTPITCTAINTGNGDVELYQSGTYTPTLTNTTNVAASTARLCTYYRVGNAVTVSGQLDIDPTGAGAVLLGISLPIASNFSTAFQLGGTASSIAIANESAGIQADATNDRASLRYVAVDTTNHTMTFTFTYQVI